MSLLGELYERGAETSVSPDAIVDGITPRQALDGIRAADRLARTIHRDVASAAVRPVFRSCWARFFNRWQAYRTLHAEDQVRLDPARVLREELPRFVAALYGWRDALIAEGGAAQASSRLAGDARVIDVKESRSFPWRPVALVSSVVVIGWIGKAWVEAYEEKQREEFERQLEAARAKWQAVAAAVPAGAVAYAPTSAPVPIIINVPVPAAPAR